MEPHLMTPSPATSTTTTPYTTAPSSPHRTSPNFFYSAPTSPIHSLVGFHDHHHDDHDHDFAFNFTTPPSLSAADELFHAGKIKPLNPPFHDQTLITPNPPKPQQEINNKSSESSSLFRISDILSSEEDSNNNNNNNNNNRKSYPTWYSKWNLKNLILFRSVSEGSARRNIEAVSKYARITKPKGDEDAKNDSSFGKLADGRCKGTRKVPVSAHEMHYTANRAVAEEMRRKTYLPYKAGLFGCLGFHNNGATSVQQISRGITCVMKQR